MTDAEVSRTLSPGKEMFCYNGQGESQSFIDPGVFSAGEGLLRLASPNGKSTVSSSQGGRDGDWSSPFSQLEATSPGSTLNFSNGSPFPFSIASPFSPLYNDSKTPVPASSTKSKHKFCSNMSSIFSPPDVFSPFKHVHKKSRGKELFADGDAYSPIGDSDASNDFQFTYHIPRSSPSLSSSALLKECMPAYHPMNLNQVHGEGRIEDRDDLSPGLSESSKQSPRSNGKSLDILCSVRTKEELEAASRKSSQKSKGALVLANSKSATRYAVNGGEANESVERGAKEAGCESFSSPNMAVRGQLPPTKISPMDHEHGAKQCNCKMTKCLKLYCECFANSKYCNDQCRCLSCHNRADKEEARQEAIQATKERNNAAFQAKVSTKGHANGCNCKKSQCLKKYCECYEGNVYCTNVCKCKNCENYEGSAGLSVVQAADRKANPSASTQSSGATVASSPAASATGPSSLKRSREGTTVSATPVHSTGSTDPKFIREADLRRSPDTLPTSQPLSPGTRLRTQSSDSTESNTVVRPLWSIPSLLGSKRPGTDIDLVRGVGSSSGLQACVKSPPRARRRDSSYAQSSVGVVGGGRTLVSGTLLLNEDSRHCLENSFGSTGSHGPGHHVYGLMSSPGLSRDINSSRSSSYSSRVSESSPASSRSGRRRRPQLSTQQGKVVYPFFGPKLPPTSKLTALKVLELLDGKDFYSMSVLNILWSNVAMDDALWE